MSRKSPKTGLPEPDLTDPENPEWTAADFARALPAHEVLPAAVLAQFPKTRGRPKVETPKSPVTIRFDAPVAQHLRQSGKGWQTRLNDVVAGLIAAGKL